MLNKLLYVSELCVYLHETIRDLQMNKAKFSNYIKLIEHSHLFFETKEDLANYFGRPYLKNSECRDCLGRSTRSEKSLRADYNRFDILAAAFSEGLFSNEEIDGRREKLSSFLELYESISQSKDFKTSLNSRPNETRGVLYSTYYIDGRDSNAIVDIINCFLRGEAKYSGAYGYFGLSLDKPHSIIGNFRLTLGILLILGAIPFCSHNTKFRGSKERLHIDTYKAISFCRQLIDSNSRAPRNILAELQILRFSENWCRFQLIYRVMKIINLYAVEVNPEIKEYALTDVSERVVRVPSFNESYWENGIEGAGNEYYKIENTGNINESSFFLYKCTPIGGIVEEERFEVALYEDGKAVISRIDSIYNFLTNNECIQVRGKYSMSDKYLEIIPEEKCAWFYRVYLVRSESQNDSWKKHVLHNGEKAREAMKILADIHCIANGQVEFIGKSGKYIYRANEKNGLKDILPRLNINSHFGIVELNGRTFAACFGYPVLYRMEVTTDIQKLEAGLIRITSK